MNKLRSSLVLGLSFAGLFYHFEMGVNALLFDGLLLLVILTDRPDLARYPGVRWSAACLLASALSLVVVNTAGAVLAHHVSLLLLIGFSQRREIRFILYALLLGLLGLCSGPLRWVKSALQHWAERGGRIGVGKYVVPVLVAAAASVPFAALYAVGSSDFLALFDGLIDAVAGSLDGRTVATVVLFLFGLNLSLVLVFPLKRAWFFSAQERLKDHLERKRETRTGRGSPLILKHVYRSALLSLFVLNALLMIVNVADVANVWIGYRPLTAPQLSQFVHAGTANLMLSIFLAMLYIIAVFRANLNFYPGARPLRLAAYAWLAQNAFLAVSVGLRNAYYVRAHGLAHGRILVIFMIILVLVGLFTLYRKVRNRLSLSYLLQVNGMALWLFLVGYGAVDWDVAITRYNLSRPTVRIDWRYLVYDLDDSNTFLLRQHLDRIPAGMRERVSNRDPASPYDWRGWNYAEWRNKK